MSSDFPILVGAMLFLAFLGYGLGYVTGFADAWAGRRLFHAFRRAWARFRGAR